MIPHIKPYLLTSFGSFTRLDYGTGHETSFALFLLCLTLTRFLQPVPEEERDIVFGVFIRYLKLCWRLQDVYQLEPAGSHGVWGLDDYAFLGYIFGSGQLRGLTRFMSPFDFWALTKPSMSRSKRNPGFVDSASAAATKQPLLHVHNTDTSNETRPFSRAFFAIVFYCGRSAYVGQSQFRTVQNVRSKLRLSFDSSHVY